MSWQPKSVSNAARNSVKIVSAMCLIFIGCIVGYEIRIKAFICAAEKNFYNGISSSQTSIDIFYGR